MLCTVEIYIKSADRQDKALVSGSTDESEQFGKKYSMHKLVMELHKSYISIMYNIFSKNSQTHSIQLPPSD